DTGGAGWMPGRRLPCRDGRSRRGRGRCGRGRATRLVGAAAPRHRTVRHLSPSTPRQRAQPVLRRRSGSQGTHVTQSARGGDPPSPTRRPRCDQRSLSPVRTRSVVPRPPWVDLGWGILPEAPRTPCAWSPATPIQSPHTCVVRLVAVRRGGRSEPFGTSPDSSVWGLQATPIDGLEGCMLSRIITARGTRVAVAAALVATEYAFSAGSPTSAAPQTMTLNVSGSGADVASGGLLAAFGGALNMPFQITSDVPAQRDPEADDQPISFTWSVTLAASVTSQVAAIDPSLTIKDITLDMG